MIGFVLGTGEGKVILEEMNKYTDDIFVSTATDFGAELYKEFKIKALNSKPLNKEEFKDIIKKYDITAFVDGSHPYAKEVSKTIISACIECNIDYVRYERKGYIESLENKEDIIFIDDYKELKDVLNNIDGSILNTTGSNNVLNIMSLNIKNRIIHRVLPSPTILAKLLDGGVKMDDLIAMKGPFGMEINNGLIKEYEVKAIITKDSGKEGGMEEKVSSALLNKCKIVVINKPQINYGNEFNNIKEMIDFMISNMLLKYKEKRIK